MRRANPGLRPVDEFELIRRFWIEPFAAGVRAAGSGVRQGPGSDCAVLLPAPGCELIISSDVFNSGIHFREADCPEWLGGYALTGALSDLAAAGAEARWFTLSLSLPEIDEAWLAGLSAGMLGCARSAGVALAGGDVSRGPLSLALTVLGQAPAGSALLRSGAAPGDAVYVSGALGGAALNWAQGRAPEAAPLRLDLGARLRTLASAAVDLSDGLLADLGHLVRSSGCDAHLDWSRIPLAAGLAGVPDAARWALAGGGDYELCFTAPAGRHGDIRALGEELGIAIAHIGELRPGSGKIEVRDVDLDALQAAGYRHFR
ncbi:MAG: thiamine-phosphate kinase [Gammaproteobacteria bacterium AqS3]|nr:thiamine-phosphate kinase [Gammaproteobacteria bacterium AqS3]